MLTTIHFKTLDDLYRFYNDSLFNGELSDCIVNMSRHSGSYGFFSAQRWRDEKNEEKTVHEISLNPDHLDRPSVLWHATLVHEMVHLWQQDLGHPSRAAYHNKEWAWKMEEVGLIPSHTGEPGGNKTGQNMSHYVNPEGKFIRVFNDLAAETLEALRLKYLPAYTVPAPVRRRRDNPEKNDQEESGTENEEEELTEKYNSKTKYTCPCGYNVWGKPRLKILCGECGENFTE
jgi:predicted SprT family Zn-dependent metalloprotease